MGLSDDQKAILRLLAQRGDEGYDDLAALMGIGVSEVHARAQEAAAQLEAEGIPAPAVPPPPAGAAQAPPAAPEKPKADEPKAPEPAIKASEPDEPKPEKAPSPVAPKARAARPSRPEFPLPSGTGARAAIAASLIVLVGLIIVLAVSGGGGSSDTTTAASGEGTTAAEEAVGATAAGSKEVTQAVLGPVGGGTAKGLVVFGRVKNSLALQIEAAGLPPTAKGQSYTVWLYESPTKMLPLATTTVGKSGKISSQVEVPTEVLAYLAKETFDQIDVSLTSDASLKASLAKATKEKKAPAYTGTDVLRGRITGPIVGAANKASE